MPLNKSVENALIPKLKQFEGSIDHFYLDSVGKVTVGVGHLIPNRSAVAPIAMKLRATQTAATIGDKLKEYDAIHKLLKGQGMQYYKTRCTLSMDTTEIERLLKKHIETFYGSLTRTYAKSKGYPADFDQLPAEVQLALFDMIFNLGPDKIVHVFKKFDAAVKKGDWLEAAVQSHRYQVQSSRNLFVKNLFIAAHDQAKLLAKKPSPAPVPRPVPLRKA